MGKCKFVSHGIQSQTFSKSEFDLHAEFDDLIGR